MATFSGQWSGCKTFVRQDTRPTTSRANRCCDCMVRQVYRRGKRCIACAAEYYSGVRHNRAVKLEGEAMYLKLKRSGVDEAVAWKMAYGDDW